MIRTADTPAQSAPTAVVVGAGLAGLAASVELAARGVRVTLVESNAHLGGKMNVLAEDTPRGRFAFDMGPTIITLPQVFRGIVERAGRRPEDYAELVDLDPQWRCLYEDGTTVDLRRDADAFAAELDRQFPDAKPGAGYKAFVAWSRRMFRLSEKVFFYNDLGSVTDLMRKPPKDPGLLGDVAAMRLHGTVAGTIAKHIDEPHLRQLCEHFLQYVGSSPFLSPAILGLIAAAQVDNGCWYPLAKQPGDGPRDAGGTRVIARSLEAIARELGVQIRTNTRVTGIIADDAGSSRGRAAGVRTTDTLTGANDEIRADAVVSNCDVQRTHRDLLGDRRSLAEQARIAKTYEPACSGVVLYLGLDRRYDHLAHHNFLFSGDSHAEFDDIYTKGVPARDPTLYIACPSKTDPGQAPEGCEAMYVLIHTPYRRDHQRWETDQPDGSPGLLDGYRRVVLDKMKRMGMPDIEDRILIEKHLTPDSIEAMYNAEGGAIYGLASHGKLAGGFKPKNRSRLWDNLYLAGGSANPGPGVPMVLMSGVTAARCCMEDLGVEPADQQPGAREPEDAPAGSRRLVHEPAPYRPAPAGEPQPA